MKSSQVLKMGVFLGQTFLLSIQLVYATSFNPQPFPKTVEDAPVVVRGKVGMNYAEWSQDSDGSRRLYTYYEIQVSEVFRGNTDGSNLVIRELGGEKDGVGLHVPGASEYSRGEDVVVLLKDKNSEGTFDVQGLMMGKYNVQTDSEGTEYLTGPGLMGEPHDNPSSKRWTLAALRTLIQFQSKMAVPQNKPNLQQNHPSPRAIIANPLTSPPAPQLQTQQEEQERSFLPEGVGLYLGVGIGFVGILGLLVVSRRKK